MGMTMINKLRRFYYASVTGRKLLGSGRKMYHFCKFRMMPEDAFIRWRFKQVYGYTPDLEQPKTFNEKLQWLKLHDRTPLHTLCADKYAVRQYVTDNVGSRYLIPLLYQSENPEDMRPENLPDPPFIIKTTHASFGGVIVREKGAIDWKSLRKSMTDQMKINYYYISKEWPYKNIKPRIVVEKLLTDRYGNVPFDYKVHCFHGEPKVIQVDLDRFTKHRRNLYDTEWRLLPFTWCDWGNGNPLWPNGKEVPIPAQLETMLKIAKRLSSEFLYARVDLYSLENSIFFGEITFCHGSGTEIFTPPEWDRQLGDMLVLPHKRENSG